jgi:hypothetical protein
MRGFRMERVDIYLMDHGREKNEETTSIISDKTLVLKIFNSNY